MLESILNFLFPTRCILCNLGNNSICNNCFSLIQIKPKENDNIYSFYEYHDIRVKKIIKQLKYFHDSQIAKMFGLAISHHSKLSLKDKILIPIPLSNVDLRLNNHAELFARNLSEKIISDLLIKKTKVQQNKTKSKLERLTNIKNTISINPKYSNLDFINKELIIVDDVWTTGSTINEAREVISKFLDIPNPEDITAITIAH